MTDLSPEREPASDIPPRHWIDDYPSWTPFLRLARVDRPIGTWLLLIPCWWGLGLAMQAWPESAASVMRLGALFAAGAFLMRAAGCTYNDLIDRDLDRRVARTRSRPLASGELTRAQGLAFLALLLAAASFVAILLPQRALVIALLSLPLVFAYPLMKRITYWPQAFLGLTFNWGVLVGFIALTDRLSWAAIALYTAGILWTIGYDTIYAHQDREDDALVGIKSTARLFGASTPSLLHVSYGFCVALIALSGYLAGASWPFFAGAALFGAHLFWQAATVDIDDPADCLGKFQSNKWAGLILLAGMIAAAPTYDPFDF